MELRLPLEMSPGREAACRAVFGTWRFFPNDARKNCPFVLTSFTGWSSERCPGIGFLSRGDREMGVLRSVEPPTRPSLECLRETGLILRCDRKVGNPLQTKQGSRPSRPDQEGRKGSEEGVPENLRVPLEGDRDFGELCGSHQGCQVPFRPPVPNVGLLLRRCSGKGLHLAMTGEPRGFSRVTAGFSSYDGEFRLPLVLAQASPIFHSSCEGKLGIALECLQGQYSSSRPVSRSQCSSPGATGISGLHSRRTRGDRHSSRVEAKNPALLSNRDGCLLELTGWTQGSQAS